MNISLLRSGVRLLHSDSRQRLPFEAIAAVLNSDRPLSPIKGSYGTAERRAIGQASSGSEILLLVKQNPGNSETLGAALQRSGELRDSNTSRILIDLIQQHEPNDVTWSIALVTLSRTPNIFNNTDSVKTAKHIYNHITHKSSATIGAALTFCAVTHNYLWACELFDEVRSYANVVHLTSYLRAVASNQEWELVFKEWDDDANPEGNAATLSVLIPHCLSAERFEMVWEKCFSSIIDANCRLFSIAMSHAMVLTSPQLVLKLESQRKQCGVPEYAFDQFNNKLYELSLWRHRMIAHHQLGDISSALEQAREVLQPYISRSVAPERQIVFKDYILKYETT